VVAIQARCEQLLRSAELLAALPLPRDVEHALLRMRATLALSDALEAQHALEAFVDSAVRRSRRSASRTPNAGCGEYEVMGGVVASRSPGHPFDAARSPRVARAARWGLACAVALGLACGWASSRSQSAGDASPLTPYHLYAAAEVVAAEGLPASSRDRCTVEISIVPRDGVSADCMVDVICPGFEHHARPTCSPHHLDEIVHIDDHSVHIDGAASEITLVDDASSVAARRRAVLRVVAW
jgi:hypothetical protein